MTSKSPSAPGGGEKPTLPEGWVDPDTIDTGHERLSQYGDRRLRDVRAFEPRSSGTAWVKLGLMVVFLVAILLFHGQISDQAAGCYQTTAGLPAGPAGNAPPSKTPVPAPPSGTHEVQIRIERQPASDTR